MKTYMYLLLLVLALALMGFFVLKQPNGQTWLSLENLLPDTLGVEQKVRVVISKLKMVYENIASEESGNVRVYRWKDANGNWNYSDKPSSTIDSEELSLNSDDVIVLPSLDTSNNSSKSRSDEKSTEILPSRKTTLPSKVLELYKDANNVQKIMDDRQQKLSNALKEPSG